MARAPPAFSDDDLLATVCMLGSNARADSVRKRLSEWLKADVPAEELCVRLQRLRDAGLLRAVPGRHNDQADFRLTAVGVEQLQGLQRGKLEPPKA